MCVRVCVCVYVPAARYLFMVHEWCGPIGLVIELMVR